MLNTALIRKAYAKLQLEEPLGAPGEEDMGRGESECWGGDCSTFSIPDDRVQNLHNEKAKQPKFPSSVFDL